MSDSIVIDLLRSIDDRLRRLENHLGLIQPELIGETVETIVNRKLVSGKIVELPKTRGKFVIVEINGEKLKVGLDDVITTNPRTQQLIADFVESKTRASGTITPAKHERDE